jgi:hypothetical protein
MKKTLSNLGILFAFLIPSAFLFYSLLEEIDVIEKTSRVVYFIALYRWRPEHVPFFQIEVGKYLSIFYALLMSVGGVFFFILSHWKKGNKGIRMFLALAVIIFSGSSVLFLDKVYSSGIANGTFWLYAASPLVLIATAYTWILMNAYISSKLFPSSSLFTFFTFTSKKELTEQAS